ncbi:MAG: hypothetical protein WC450_02330 [Candidatus Omnitrophota bacterium]|jgi:hypothetical protein
MKLVEKYIYDYLGTKVMTLEESGFRVSYKNLISSSSRIFDYSEFKPKFEDVQYGETGWDNFGWFFIIISIILSFVDEIIKDKAVLIIVAYTMGASLVLAILFFLLKFYKKNYVYFFNKDNQGYIAIKSNDKSKAFIDELKKRILENNL